MGWSRIRSRVGSHDYRSCDYSVIKTAPTIETQARSPIETVVKRDITLINALSHQAKILLLVSAISALVIGANKKT